MSKNIAIIGAGISGMSTAYLLSGNGCRVTIFATAFSPYLTSNKAAAFWFPYHIRNDKRGIGWCNTSYQYYRSFSDQPQTGISMCQLKKVLRVNTAEEEPVWISFMPEGCCRAMEREELAPGIERAYDVTVPLIETQIFLPWLQQQLLQRGVLFVEREINDFGEIAGQFDWVINCSALGARKLCNDDTVIPVRGQVALLEPRSGMSIYLDNESLLYVVPRKDAIIVGGTYEAGIETTDTEPATIERLLQNAFEVLPELKEQAFIGSWAGVRPFRAEVRVEQEAGKNIIHNYGHGGSGFTLAFGCAETVCNMVLSTQYSVLSTE
ncbi:MAG: FAD-dependent oxidoreductase [Ferruginibacter sp.]|nr:FAD-dependent oxidoreductase [Ferruginibacter sp.]